MSNFDFDCVYTADGALARDNTPDVWYGPDGDVVVYGDGWGAITGITGQYGYSGAVMHPSESMDDEQVLRAVRERGGSRFAIVEVRDEDGDYPEGDPIGWAIVYR